MALLGSSAEAASWWNAKWTIRKQITLDCSETGLKIADAIGSSSVLLRLHDGNFQFLSARENGSDIRFIAEDDKTELSHHIEKFDGLLNEAFVWVTLPDLKPGSKTSFWLYYGQVDEALPATPNKDAYDKDTALVYHFSEASGPALDFSGNGLKAGGPGVPVGGGIIAGALRLTGESPITIPANPRLEQAAAGALTISLWYKPLALQGKANLITQGDASNALRLGDDNGQPFVEVISNGRSQRSPGGNAIATNTWHHLAAVAGPTSITLFLDGKLHSTLNSALPVLKGPIELGAGRDGNPGFSGELDELQIATAARPAGWLSLAAVNQGASNEAQKLLVIGNDQASNAGHSELAEHLSLLGSISKSLTFDGWVVIVLCALLALVGWIITIGKLIYLHKVDKASAAFLQVWPSLARGITALDHGDEASVNTLGGRVQGSKARLVAQSPLFHLFRLGSQEIHLRKSDADAQPFQGLSARAIAAIRAVLDGGQTREVMRLGNKLVFLTIGIAGGPYLGLLGTVIGVMITFAVIAQSGEVEINSIAPGIAGALLATVAGLAVAIPALFAYSYLNTRIKENVSAMHMFIDELVARIAEAYPTTKE